MKTTNQTKFSEIVEACGESQRYGIYPGKDICKGSADLYGFWKRKSMPWKSSIRRTDRSDQTNLKKLGDKTGILHLESYSENNTTITFEMEDISQEN